MCLACTTMRQLYTAMRQLCTTMRHHQAVAVSIALDLLTGRAIACLAGVQGGHAAAAVRLGAAQLAGALEFGDPRTAPVVALVWQAS